MAKEQLAATVYVTDPETHQAVTLHPGTLPEPRLAALVTNPAAWVDGKLPAAAKEAAEQQEESPTGDGQDGASGAASDASGDGDDKAAPAAKKTAARKTAATRPARGRDAADQGDGGE